MRNKVSKVLLDLFTVYGVSLASDKNRLNGLLRDSFPKRFAEVNVLIYAIELGIVNDLYSERSSQIPKTQFYESLISRLQHDYGTEIGLAKWAVETWAIALGLKIPLDEERKNYDQYSVNDFDEDDLSLEYFEQLNQFAEQGNARAQANLGWMYQNGYGVKLNDIEAVEWYRRSAEQGDADAQFYLGLMQKQDKNARQAAKLAKAKSHRDAAFLRGNRELVAHPVPVSAKRFTIGQEYGGGIIFYVDESGQSGLIAAKSDILGLYSWSNANAACNNLVNGGFSDWRLPTKDELNKLYFKGVVGGFADYYYWSSSEGTAIGAWGQDFFDGFKLINYKTNSGRVRAVRAFTY
jgi:hypothetical protein